jgi:hypothetical protein
MSKEPETINPLDPFGALNTMRDASMQTWNSMRDANMQTWSKMMIDFVNSETYSKATAQWLDTYLMMSQPFQRVIEKTTTQVLTGLNMPVRTDMISLAERLTNVEMRLDDLDAKLDDILRAVQSLASSHQITDNTNHAAGTSKTRTKAKEAQ